MSMFSNIFMLMGFVHIKIIYTILSLKYMYIYYGLNLNYQDCKKATQHTMMQALL